MTNTRSLATATTALALALSPILAAAPALAQETAPVQDGAETGAAFSDELIQAFVAATLDVDTVLQGYKSQLEETADPTAQQEIVDEANAEILVVVDGAEGITVEEYLEIGQTAAADPELNARIAALLQEEAPMPGG